MTQIRNIILPAKSAQTKTREAFRMTGPVICNHGNPQGSVVGGKI